MITLDSRPEGPANLYMEGVDLFLATKLKVKIIIYIYIYINGYKYHIYIYIHIDNMPVSDPIQSYVSCVAHNMWCICEYLLFLEFV